jgi:hypothetical protein
LRAAGVTPAICGYDTPVFLGQGPLDDTGNAKLNKDQPMYPILPDTEVPERKMDQGRRRCGRRAEAGPQAHRRGYHGKTTLVPISHMAKVNNQYRLAHKRVLRIDNSGNIAFGLAGWSDKG